jgi:molybdopterin converting factor small subunit
VATVTVRVPRMLSGFTDGALELDIDADTLAGALRALTTRHPALGVHLFDEGGTLRGHVLCFHNEDNTRWLSSLDRPVKSGDVITIMQAVTGG